MILNTFSNSINSIFNLIGVRNDLGKSYERLSSGLRINRASDDPAGLVISEKMRSRISEISQLIRNIEYKDNKYTTAESGLASMQTNLREMRNMALAASDDGAVTDDMRRAYQTVMDRNIEGFNNIIDNTSFGVQPLLDGSEGSVADIGKLDRIDISDPEKAAEAVKLIDEKTDEILNARAEIGAKQKYEFESQKDNLQTEFVNLTQAESSIRDTDMALEYSRMIGNEIKLKAGFVLLAHKSLMSGILVNLLSR